MKYEIRKSKHDGFVRVGFDNNCTSFLMKKNGLEDLENCTIRFLESLNHNYQVNVPDAVIFRKGPQVFVELIKIDEYDELAYDIASMHNIE